MAFKYLAIFIVIYLALFLAGFWFLRLAVLVKTPKDRIFDRACKENDRSPYEEAKADPWFQQIAQGQRRTLKLGRLTLSAVLIPGAETHRYVLCCHDYATDGRYTAAYARLFHQRGFTLLIPDARACGQSSGKLLGMGFAERVEVKAWVDSIVAQDAQAEIYLFGLGTGAASELFYACRRPDAHVKGVIADSCYAGLWEVVLAHLMPTLGAVAKVVAGFSNTEYMVCAGTKNNWRKADLWHQIGACSLPVLLIHGEEDYLFPVKHLEVLQEQAQCPLTVLRLPHAGHIACLAEDPQQYQQALDTFLNA